MWTERKPSSPASRQLDPARRIEPRKEAVKFSVESLTKAGTYLAERGDVEGATARFAAARKLDPDLHA